MTAEPETDLPARSEPMGGAMERLPRRLDEIECRVLGALLEKEQTTPEYYPLTVNALVAACNQRTNRDPVTDLDERDVHAALDRLRKSVLAWNTEGARTERWRHALDRRWRLEPATKALITLLLLRGPQTPGELRARSERMHRFGSPGEVESALRRLAEGREPLVRELPRAPGQKENRWVHLAGEEPRAGGAGIAAAGSLRAPAPEPVRDRPAVAGARSEAPRGGEPEPDELTARIAALEARVAALERWLGDGGRE